jgi:hypothetical protein
LKENAVASIDDSSTVLLVKSSEHANEQFAQQKTVVANEGQ